MTWKRRTPAANGRRRRREECMLRADRRFVQWCEYFGKLGGEYWNTERRRRLLATVTRARRLGQSLLQANGATIVGSAGAAAVVVSPPLVLKLQPNAPASA